MSALKRKQALPFVAAVVVCTFVMVVGIYSIANTEFTSSVWATNGHVPPAITGLFRGVYKYVWLTMLLNLLWAAYFIARKESSIASLGWFAAAAAVQWTFWLMFMLLALYLVNQTFKV